MEFRKKPIVVEAEQFTGESLYGYTVLKTEITKEPLKIEIRQMVIPTLEGTMYADVGDWIITGVNGERYPCKPDIFEKTYEPADSEEE